MMSPNGCRTVLLVDDDELVLHFTTVSLKKAHFTVLAAPDGSEALNVYHDQRDKIDIVVTDMVMPHLLGDQLAVRLWKLEPELPILFVSGNSPDNLASKVTLEPGVNFFQKPFAILQLVEAMNRQLENPNCLLRSDAVIIES